MPITMRHGMVGIGVAGLVGIGVWMWGIPRMSPPRRATPSPEANVQVVQYAQKWLHTVHSPLAATQGRITASLVHAPSAPSSWSHWTVAGIQGTTRANAAYFHHVERVVPGLTPQVLQAGIRTAADAARMALGNNPLQVIGRLDPSEASTLAADYGYLLVYGDWASRRYVYGGTITVVTSYPSSYPISVRQLTPPKSARWPVTAQLLVPMRVRLYESLAGHRVTQTMEGEVFMDRVGRTPRTSTWMIGQTEFDLVPGQRPITLPDER
ncbi:hypothetical protein [Sulfobacillus sp. hq2]|uniref:hypothetical protein n=1 Tax=Sulfobacillus TaxID=28033 RepID=UPI000CD0BFE0|nr:hypothetical protein [Sulfobacillus sp. hq2]POB09673.1 hypothetical protein CO251_15835 [Sulfobacillus sp. hq2]